MEEANLSVVHNDELYNANIRNYLIQRSHAVRVDANRNLLNLSILSEDFYAEFLNILLDLQLKNANASDRNAKGIDLIDPENRVAVQVSVICAPDTIRAKIRGSIQKFEKPEDEEWQFYYVPITDEAPKLKTDFILPKGLQFDRSKDVLDITRIMVLASEHHKLKPLSQLVDLYSKKNIPAIHTDNELYKNAFLEPLFLHKQDTQNNKKVCLKNLFILHDYSKEGSRRVYSNLSQFLKDFITGDKRLLIIEGNAGCGKSSLVSWMSYHFENKDKVFDRIFLGVNLIIIRLRELDRAQISGKSFIPAILAYMNVNSIDQLSKLFPNAVLVLDGFDELCMIEKATNMIWLIEDAIERLPLDAKIIITTRPEYVDSYLQIQCERIYLHHFNSKQRTLWLKKYTSKRYCAQIIDPEIAQYISLIDKWTTAAVCDTPMTLYMIAASKINKEVLENCWRLYRQIFYVDITKTEYNRMFPNQSHNYAHDIVECRDALFRITEEIAFEMFRNMNNKFYLTREEIDIIIDNVDKDGHFHMSESKKCLLQKCYALNTFWKERSNDGAVEFYHNNIRDFFLCEKIMRELNQVYNKLRMRKIQREVAIEELDRLFSVMFKYDMVNSIVNTFIMYREIFCKTDPQEFAFIEQNERLLPDIFEKMIKNGLPVDQFYLNIIGSVIDVYRYAYQPFISNGELVKWWNNVSIANHSEIIQNHFQSIFLNTPVMDETDNPVTPSSNSDFSGLNLCNQDLRNIGFYYSSLQKACLKRSKLEGSSLEGTNLKGADLSDADIHYSSLEKANLEYADLRGSQLKGTELPDGFCSDDEQEQKEHLKKMQIRGLKI